MHCVCLFFAQFVIYAAISCPCSRFKWPRHMRKRSTQDPGEGDNVAVIVETILSCIWKQSPTSTIALPIIILHTEQPRVLMEVGHPAQNPAIGSACRAFAAVATPRESPSYNSQSVFFGAVARIVELGYWVKTARQQQLSKHHHHHHHPWKQQQ